MTLGVWEFFSGHAVFLLRVQTRAKGALRSTHTCVWLVIAGHSQIAHTVLKTITYALL